MYACVYILIFNKSIQEYISVLYRYKLNFSRSMLTEACFIKTYISQNLWSDDRRNTFILNV